jgi:predicted nucleotidyltransferase
LTDKHQIKRIEEAILSVLKYYSLFSYPLKVEEIHRFLSVHSNLEEVQNRLKNLVSAEQVFQLSDEFYSIENQSDWVDKRLTGNQRAEELLASSKKYIRKIIRFPFVKSVAISGSLSKYYTDEDGDIDYFIITKENRLWIARSLLHLFKKTSFLRKREHYYCMNYFVDESALEIDQQNIYSAIETVTLIPVFNETLITELKQKNRFWVEKFLPNEPYENDQRFLVKLRGGFIKKLFEKLIDILGPESMNQSLMKMTDSKWRKKWAAKSYPMEQYDQAFYTTLHISKNHPANYQKQILNALDSKDQKELTKEFEECEI